MPRVRIVWHAGDQEAVLKALESGREGLSPVEAESRLKSDGANVLAEAKKATLLSIFLKQFKSVMIWALVAAALISAIFSSWLDALVIAVVVLLNAVMGTIQESRAEAALDALKQMTAPFATVVRAGLIRRIPASDLVPGDVVELEAGDSVPADIRLLECSSLRIEESALTGESEPTEKFSAVVDDPSAAVADRKNMAHMGTNVTYGKAVGVVTATGMDTQMGRIARQLAQGEKEPTPLQRTLNQMANYISIGVIAIAAIIFIVGLLYERPPLDMFMTAVSLAVAAIPEGMVAVVTIVLAIGMQKMAAKGAIIRSLPAVETLGSAQVICSDKTGTLTQNRMTVQCLFTKSNKATALKGAMFHCNDSRPSDDGSIIGDPTEAAMLNYLLETKTCNLEHLRSRRRVDEIPFDSERKLSSVVIQLPSGKLRVYVKGAADVLLGRCVGIEAEGGRREMDADSLAEVLAVNADMAANALRVLAFAYKDVDDVDTSKQTATESGLVFLGLAGMIDPPRPEAKLAIAECRGAGITPVMITGDHRLTAEAIAKELGILGDGRAAVSSHELADMDEETLYENIERIAVYARVAPEDKSRIIRAWQRGNKVVAMTGDGVNDAPALQIADIGVGMGITGTDVSRSAADMVLSDDNFATIVTAVEEGRRIFDNIHKAVKFLLSSNMGEVIAVLAATFLDFSILAPAHILWVNLVTDSFPAVALGMEPAEEDIMKRSPRDPEKPFFSPVDWAKMGFTSVLEAAMTLIAFVIGNKISAETGRSMAFVTLALTQLVAALSFHSSDSILKTRPGRHKQLWLGLGVSLALQLIVMLIPAVSGLFGVAALGGLAWLQVLIICLVTLAILEGYKAMVKLLKIEG